MKLRCVWLTDRRIEIIAVIIISVAAVASAWCAYESARWSSVQAASYSRANATRIESLRKSDEANRQVTIDVNLFTTYANAVSTKNDRLAAFLSQRFPDRLKIAMRAWLATNPLVNKSAPSSPFVMSQYHLSSLDRANELEDRAGDLFQQGVQANETSDKYVLMTVLFAAVSFLAGVGSKFDIRSVVLAALTLGAIVWIVAFIVMLGYPIR